MGKDYVLFIHGVNVRERNYADQLFDLIQKVAPNLNLRKVALYWGDVNADSLQELTSALQASSVWSKLWFQDFRKKQLLQFAGDAALYISRHVGSLAVTQMREQALKGLQDYQPGQDRLHLVTHSWGTVILFDVLFANRWTEREVPLEGRESVQAVRARVLGLDPNPADGLRLASIHTMGSPISLFSLITITGKNNQGGSTHDIIPGLGDLLEKLYPQGAELPWQNFIHPGDPVAWPLEKVVPILMGDKYVNVKDILTQGSGPLELLAKPIQQTFLALVNGGSAHGSYWQNKEVAQKIGKTILAVANK